MGVYLSEVDDKFKPGYFEYLNRMGLGDLIDIDMPGFNMGGYTGREIAEDAATHGLYLSEVEKQFQPEYLKYLQEMGLKGLMKNDGDMSVGPLGGNPMKQQMDSDGVASVEVMSGPLMGKMSRDTASFMMKEKRDDEMHTLDMKLKMDMHNEKKKQMKKDSAMKKKAAE